MEKHQPRGLLAQKTTSEVGNSTLSRREIFKQSGLTALGLIYITPKVEIIRSVSKSTMNNSEISGFVCASDSGSGSDSTSGSCSGSKS